MEYLGGTISVGEAADMLGLCKQKVRQAMQAGELKIGYVIQSPKRCTYRIYRDMLTEEIKRLSKTDT